ncbi:hypothetical protein DOTSEDRAFT_167188 [Dothistroma septosporum NZE10]|uniref:Large ribosomal subunit protein mL38 n=1 Tax=Dothistroma septosporum (strain NZE10 / CBS 128990) TaxID=675120 RepID=N1PZI9_DOTSN|nr:hypothetical protein DOTSEDRAFT_167188 [Dothistroma septosporum NZE10]
MALERSVRPLARCLRCARHERISLPIRTLSSSAAQYDAEVQQSTRPTLDPFNVTTPKQERRLMRDQNKMPVGSRRRRAAMLSSPNIPFVELPYQCFQEARNILQEDRHEKLEQIRVMRERIARLSDNVVVDETEQAKKEHQLRSMRHHLEELKILADINDPIVKKKFEDGQADMSKPIYRYLADKDWRSYKRTVLMQRIDQMTVTPDVLPKIDPTVETILSFPAPGSTYRRRLVQHGDFVDSRISETAPQLQVRKFDKGEKLYTIAVINSDVPNVEKDGFDYRCHFLACNVPVSPTNGVIRLGSLDQNTQVVLPWLPAYAQKGAPYQRLSIWLLEQPPAEEVAAGSGEVAPSKVIDLPGAKSQSERQVKANKKHYTRENFILRSLVDAYRLVPVGVDLFRTQWDEGTAEVMRRAGIVGWDVEFKRKRIEPLPYKRLKEERYR